MLETTVIISARGEATFTSPQLERLKQLPGVTFVSVETQLTDNQFLEISGEATWLAFTRRATKNFHSDIISRIPNLKGVAVYATGYEWLDLKELEQRKIIVSFLPDYSAVTVAEHTLGMILSLLRRIHLSHDRVRGVAPPHVSLRGSELRGKAIGLIGFGTIARALFPLLLPFFPPIFIHDIRSIEDGVAEMPGPGNLTVEIVPLQRLLSESEIVVLLADQKRGDPPILDREHLSMMRKGSYLINPARPGLVDHEALIGLIGSGQIAGYGVDDNINILTRADLEYGRILQTDHSGWYSNEAMERGTEGWVQNIIAMVSGNPENLVTLLQTPMPDREKKNNE